MLEWLLLLAVIALLLVAPEPSRAAGISGKQTVAQGILEPHATGNDPAALWSGCAIACPWSGAAVRK